MVQLYTKHDAMPSVAKLGLRGTYNPRSDSLSGGYRSSMPRLPAVLDEREVSIL